MGGTTWASTASASAYRSMSADYVTKGATRDEIFTSRNVHAAFNPANIKVRESCDSEANPNSTPIILGLDVTGSMGFIPEYLVKEGFGPLIESIIDKHPIADPHVMVMAIGDLAAGDRGPLQASQFEADIRIVEQLTQLWLEGRGGGNGWESYDLPWLFAGLKTKTDSWDKRGKKGYLFTFGDEPPPPINHTYGKKLLNSLLGAGTVDQDYTTVELLRLAMQRWAVFHVVVEQGSHARRDRKGVVNDWMKLFGEADNAPNLICLNDYKKLPEVVTAVLQVAEGADPDTIVSQAGDAKDAVMHAFGSIER